MWKDREFKAVVVPQVLHQGGRFLFFFRFADGEWSVVCAYEIAFFVYLDVRSKPNGLADGSIRRSLGGSRP